jgi:hypothetical protein
MKGEVPAAEPQAAACFRKAGVFPGKPQLQQQPQGQHDRVQVRHAVKPTDAAFRARRPVHDRGTPDPFSGAFEGEVGEISKDVFGRR